MTAFPGPSSYATRVKAITNNAQRNVESKEIAQLKEVRLTVLCFSPQCQNHHILMSLVFPNS